ncbi:FAD-dependent oxidoreductase [Chloroflexota bacterium]
MQQLKLLFSPIKVGTMELRNRIMMPAMGVSIGNPDGTINDKFIDYYVARAKGGVALITTEVACIDPIGQRIPNQLGIYDDKFIPGLAKLAKAIHAHGAKLSTQLHHSGRETRSSLTGKQPVAPSAVPSLSTTDPALREVPKELTEEEIWELIEKYAEAARRARDAGFDAVELHGAHGYLIAQFLSPLTNKRIDAFGGSIDGRLKFVLEVIKAVRGKIGKDFPLSIKISANENMPCGLTIEETSVIAPIIANAGIDAILVSQGTMPKIWTQLPTHGMSITPWISDVEAIKRTVNVPVAAVGRIAHPLIAEQVLEQGKADIIALGRSLLADAEFPNKAAAGKLEDIRYCIYCNNCVESRALTGIIKCTVNPELGQEREMTLTPAKQKKKVLVIGGGPGGLEAARGAALRGHDVTLSEKEDRPGGEFTTAAIPPGKQELTHCIKWLWLQAEKAGVKIQLGKKVTPADVDKTKPDVVIVATGGVPITPAGIPGIDKANVVNAQNVLKEKVSLGKKVAILGGGMIGSETADYLGEAGYDVTLIEMLEDIAMDMNMFIRPTLLERLEQHKVKKITSAKVKAITDDGVVVDRDGREETISGMDSIVLALGVKPENELADQVKKKVAEVYVIGDASEPRKAVNAIAEAAEIARQI